jgi:uncharacterized integral membrane protein
MRHPAPLTRAGLLGLLVIVILQNMEPTDIDFLFWSLRDIPKLIVILAAMAIGALVWEVGRRLWFRNP